MRYAILLSALLASTPAYAQVTCNTVGTTTMCSNGVTIYSSPIPSVPPYVTQPHAFTQGLVGGAYALESVERAELTRRQAEQLPPARQCPIGLRWLGVC